MRSVPPNSTSSSRPTYSTSSRNGSGAVRRFRVGWFKGITKAVVGSLTTATWSCMTPSPLAKRLTDAAGTAHHVHEVGLTQGLRGGVAWPAMGRGAVGVSANRPYKGRPAFLKKKKKNHDAGAVASTTRTRSRLSGPQRRNRHAHSYRLFGLDLPSCWFETTIGLVRDFDTCVTRTSSRCFGEADHRAPHCGERSVIPLHSTAPTRRRVTPHAVARCARRARELLVTE